MEQLKDIRAIEIIEVNFLTYFILLTLIILSISVLIYFISYKKTKLTKREKTIKILKDLDFDSYTHKDLAYMFTIYGKECIKSEYQNKFDNILVQLEYYKYKKENEKIPKNILDKMKIYINELV